jgi:tRNA nucleotidyltransferase/poly(A) polymerase
MEITKLSEQVLKTRLPDLKLGNCFICGGAIRDSILGVKYDDIDVFSLNKKDMDDFASANLNKAKKIYDSDALKTFFA